MRQNWCTPENAPMTAKSSTVTCPASVAALAKMVSLPTCQSWATWVDAMRKFRSHTLPPGTRRGERSRWGEPAAPSWGITEGRENLSLRHELVRHVGFAAHQGGAAPQLEDFHFQTQLVPRDHGAPELRLVDSG